MGSKLATLPKSRATSLAGALLDEDVFALLEVVTEDTVIAWLELLDIELAVLLRVSVLLDISLMLVLEDPGDAVVDDVEFLFPPPLPQALKHKTNIGSRHCDSFFINLSWLP